MPTVSLNGFDLYYDEGGAGQPDASHTLVHRNTEMSDKTIAFIEEHRFGREQCSAIEEFISL